MTQKQLVGSNPARERKKLNQFSFLAMTSRDGADETRTVGLHGTTSRCEGFESGLSSATAGAADFAHASSAFFLHFKMEVAVVAASLASEQPLDPNVGTVGSKKIN
jgi:hypothetical protein